MDVLERKTILESLKYVSEVFISIDEDETVSKSIESLALSKKYNIKYFLNGGDRKSSKDIPEFEVCKKYDIELKFDLGGIKENSSSDLITNLMSTLSIEDFPNTLVVKPWGYYKIFYSNSNSCLKKLVINPGEEISYQFHNERSEHWVLMDGHVNIKINDEFRELFQGDYILIGKNLKHSIINNSKKQAVIAEVQYGEIIDENDIVRIEDKYNRK